MKSRRGFIQAVDVTTGERIGNTGPCNYRVRVGDSLDDLIVDVDNVDPWEPSLLGRTVEIWLFDSETDESLVPMSRQVHALRPGDQLSVQKISD